MAVAMAALFKNASAMKVSVTVDNPADMHLTDAKGYEFELAEGENTITLEEDQNPVTLSKSDTGKLTEVIYNGDWMFPAAGPHTFYFEDGDRLKVYTFFDSGMVTLAINANNPAATDIRVNGESRQPGALQVKVGSEVEIIRQPGYVIDRVSFSADIDVTQDGDTWSFTASRNVTIDIVSHLDVAENVKINVDNATNMTVTDALGAVVPLKDGDNYITMDVAKQSPLSVVANPGAMMEMVVVNGNLLFPDDKGVYTLTLPAEGFIEIYLLSKRDQANTITINVDDASRVSVSDANGIIDLQDGSNYITFDFDNGNPVTVTAAEGAVLRGVTLDGDVLSVTDNMVSFFVVRGSVIDISTADDSPVETGWIVIADEDFSGLASGTPAQPDMTAEIYDTFGDALPSAGFKPYHESCTRTWGGDRYYPAGGTLAVMGGFLNTPTGDYSGDLKMTFRARILPGEAAKRHGLDVMLIRRSRLDEFKRTTYTLTDEWQEFSFTADNGWFYDTMIQFFSLDDFCYELDDVHIEHRITGIEPPTAYLAEDMTNDSFLAVWDSTETAEEYLLSVYEHGPSDGGYQLDEDFESVVTADSHVSSMPEGWEFNLAANGNRKEFTTDDAYTGSGNMAICFDAGGDYIVTPVATAGITEFSFFLSADTSDPAYDPNLGQVVAVGVLIDGGWRDLASISVPALVQSYEGKAVVDLTENLSVYDNIYAFRLEAVMHEHDRVMMYIDDVKYTVAGTPQPIYLFEDKVIEGQGNTTYLVDGDDFDPEADYFYTVKARNSRYTSVASNEIEVFNIHIPEALEASDITADSFCANWECGGKADEFVLSLYQTLTAPEDDESMIVLHEDFSKAKGSGTPFAPTYTNPTREYEPIDNYTCMPGWTASSYSIIDGMLGGMAEDTDPYMPALAGAISTPVMDLSNDEGRCRVKVRGWFRGGDGLVIRGTNQATFGAVPVSADGEYEIEMELANCGSKEVLTFYSPAYRDFMIDEITITQHLRKNDKVKIRTHEIQVNDKSARRYTVSGLEIYPGYDLSYDMYAKRFFHGNVNEAYTSFSSNEVGVKLDPSGVMNVADGDKGFVVAAGDGYISVEASCEGPLEVYGVDGRLILSTEVQPGSHRYPLPEGIYIVRLNGNACKLLL